jgi:hypothetical protein
MTKAWELNVQITSGCQGVSDHRVRGGCNARRQSIVPDPKPRCLRYKYGTSAKNQNLQTGLITSCSELTAWNNVPSNYAIPNSFFLLFRSMHNTKFMQLLALWMAAFIGLRSADSLGETSLMSALKLYNKLTLCTFPSKVKHAVGYK